MADNDLTETIGRRGQSIAEARLLDLGAKGKPLFRPVPLGDKWPTTDLYVELLDTGLKVTPFFFIQVKSTNEGFQKRSRNLNVKLARLDIDRLVAIPAPTYLVGVEVKTDRDAFIWAIQARQKSSITSVPTKYDLSYPNLERLYNEVRAFWNANHAKPKSSYFEV